MMDRGTGHGEKMVAGVSDSEFEICWLRSDWWPV